MTLYVWNLESVQYFLKEIRTNIEKQQTKLMIKLEKSQIIRFLIKNSKFVFFSYIICTLILIIFPFWKFKNTSCFHFGIDILEEQKKIINIRLNWMGSWIINFYNNLWNIISLRYKRYKNTNVIKTVLINFKLAVLFF